MTVCIAAICDGGKSIVAASDRMITSLWLSIEFPHRQPKINSISENCIVLSAGNAVAHTKVIEKAHKYLEEATNPNIDEISNCLGRAYQDSRRRLVESIVFTPRGLSFETFYSRLNQELSPDLVQMLDSDVQRINLGLELIIAGVDNKGAHIHGIREPGIVDCYDAIGFHVIGSGLPHALVMLAFQHNMDDNVKDMIKHVHKVKKKSEIAPGVGKETDMVAITQSGTEKVDTEALEGSEGD